MCYVHVQSASRQGITIRSLVCYNTEYVEFSAYFFFSYNYNYYYYLIEAAAVSVEEPHLRYHAQFRTLFMVGDFVSSDYTEIIL